MNSSERNYSVVFYNNNGEKTFSTFGKNVKLIQNCSNLEESPLPSDSSDSPLKIDIDGKRIINYGETIIISNTHLNEVVDFSASGIKQEKLNSRKQILTKKNLLIIKSQLGIPICIFTGNDISCKIYDNLPKTSKFVIDDYSIYAHRVNFQIIETSLI